MIVSSVLHRSHYEELASAMTPQFLMSWVQLVAQSPLSRTNGWATLTHDRCVKVLLPSITTPLFRSAVPG
jgi:hypothetical protein